MIINSPNDEEVQYTADKVTSNTIVVMESSVSQKEFPVLTQQRLKDASNTALYQYVPVQSTSTLIKYPGNSSCKCISL